MDLELMINSFPKLLDAAVTVSYTHLRAHETGRSRMPSSA